MSQIDITKLLLANFSGSKQAEEQAKELRLGFQTNYTSRGQVFGF